MASSRFFIGNGSPVGSVTLSEPNKTKDKSVTLYKCLNDEGKRLSVQFGKGTQSLVGCKVISFQDQRDNSKTKRIIFVNAERNPKVATDIEALMDKVCEVLHDGRAMYWPGKNLSSLKSADLRTCASAVLKNNKVTDETEALVKCRDATKMNPGTQFYKMSFEEDAKGKKRMVKKEIVDFGDSSRSYEGLVSCQLGVYTGFQNKSPTWGIYLTASEAYLSDPEGESPGGMKSLAASETITLDDEGDDAIEVTVDPARLLVSSMGDQEVDEDDLRSEDSASVGGKRSATAPGFTPSKKQR